MEVSNTTPRYYYLIIIIHDKDIDVYNKKFIFIFNVLLQCCSTALTCTALNCTSLQGKCILSRALECSALHCVSQTSLHFRGKKLW